MEWVEIIEPKSHEHMYANLATGECLWEPPPGAQVKKSNDKQWWELFDVNTNRYYYYNATTHRTVWNRPEHCDIIPLAKLQTIKDNTSPPTGFVGSECTALGGSEQELPQKNDELTASKLSLRSIACQTGSSSSGSGTSTRHHHHHKHGGNRHRAHHHSSTCRSRRHQQNHSTSTRCAASSTVSPCIGEGPSPKLPSDEFASLNIESGDESSIRGQPDRFPLTSDCQQQLDSKEGSSFVRRSTASNGSIGGFPTSKGITSSPVLMTKQTSLAQVDHVFGAENSVASLPRSCSERCRGGSDFQQRYPVAQLNASQSFRAPRGTNGNPSVASAYRYSPASFCTMGRQPPSHFGTGTIASTTTAGMAPVVAGKMKGRNFSGSRDSSLDSFGASSTGGSSSGPPKPSASIPQQPPPPGGSPQTFSGSHRIWGQKPLLPPHHHQEQHTMPQQLVRNSTVVSGNATINESFRQHHQDLLSDEEDEEGSTTDSSDDEAEEIAAAASSCSGTPELVRVAPPQPAPRHFQHPLLGAAQLQPQHWHPPPPLSSMSKIKFSQAHQQFILDEKAETCLDDSLHTSTEDGKSGTHDMSDSEDFEAVPSDFETAPALLDGKGCNDTATNSTAPTTQRTTVETVGTLSAGGHSNLPDNVDLERRSGGIFKKKKDPETLLSWTREPLKKPLILTSDKEIKKESLLTFRRIQAYMGDRKVKPGQSLDSLALQLCTLGWQKPAIRDEIYLQLVKQTSDNPRPESLRRGWELLAVCLNFFPPSVQCSPFLENYITQNSDSVLDLPEVEVSHYADYSGKKLTRIMLQGAKKGIRKPTKEEVEQARLQIWNPSMFGNSLTEVMNIQSKKFPSRLLPWIQTTLSELILQLNGAQTEGIFRVPGDIDEVNALKTRLDQWLVPIINDPHVPASLLKLWYRELAEPLVPHDYYQAALNACEDPQEAGNVVKKLPKLNRLVFTYLIQFCQIFIKPENVAHTKMDSANLAMVMAPNCLRSEETEPHKIFENTRKEMKFLRTLMESFEPMDNLDGL